MAQWVKNPTVVSQVVCCYSCGVGVGHSYGLDSIPGPGTSIYHGYGYKKKKKVFKEGNFVEYINGNQKDKIWQYAYLSFLLRLLTNCHKLSDVEQYTFIIFQFQCTEPYINGSHWAKIKVSPGLCSFLKPLRRICFPVLSKF